MSPCPGSCCGQWEAEVINKWEFGDRKAGTRGVGSPKLVLGAKGRLIQMQNKTAKNFGTVARGH